MEQVANVAGQQHGGVHDDIGVAADIIRVVTDDEDEEEGDQAYYLEEDDDDTVSEGDEKEEEKLAEPSLEYHGGKNFSELCQKLEHISSCLRGCNIKILLAWQLRKQKMLDLLIPAQVFALEEEKIQKSLQNPGEETPPESIFPLLRLLYPDKDASRRMAMKERKVAEAYIDAFGWTQNFTEFHMLKNHNDPGIVGQEPGLAGNFSLVLQKVLMGINGETRMDATPSNLTLNDINHALDVLASIHKGSFSKARRALWFKQFTQGPRRIPPLEHKWLVRIVTGRVDFGIGLEVVLKHYHYTAVQIYEENYRSLKWTCAQLCYIPRLKHTTNDEVAAYSAGTLSYLQGPSRREALRVQLGKTFSPMLSQRTSFERILNDISKQHRAFARAATKAAANRDESHRATNSLACQHPAFTIETKLDGDRMIMHYERNGCLVKFHSRHGKWFSTLYSPVLGPAIRKAFGWADLDLILDGEVIGWDSGCVETVPFGFNRTIAQKRQEYMNRNGLLDRRDKDLHKDEKEANVYNMTTSWDGHSSEETADIMGNKCWLQYIVFDVVYVGGPGAMDFLSKTVSSYIKPDPGCIMGLDAFERKKILYRLCHPQVNEVEIVPTLIVRPNGSTALGSKYFSDIDPLQEYSHPAHKIDSIASLLEDHVPDIELIDEKQRERLSDEEISQGRANAIDWHYKEIVKEGRVEGLVFKDLNTPYVLDFESRGPRYWHKFKPGYFNGSIASDLDVVVVGAYFATGMHHCMKPTRFLVACLDGQLFKDCGEIKFLTLCKVSCGSSFRALNTLLHETGFRDATRGQPVDYGKWFLPDGHGNAPDFISSRVLGEESSQLDYPDLWIEPENSKILTLDAGEIVCSNAFSAGLTLRFPTITKIRVDADDKPRHEIECDLSLWAKYNSVLDSSSSRHGQTKCRFFADRQQHQQLTHNTRSVETKKRGPIPPSWQYETTKHLKSDDANS